MHPRERDIASLWDMREAARLIASFLHGVSYTDYEKILCFVLRLNASLKLLGKQPVVCRPSFSAHILKLPGVI
jgi:hypothetical protein